MVVLFHSWRLQNASNLGLKKTDERFQLKMFIYFTIHLKLSFSGCFFYFVDNISGLEGGGRSGRVARVGRLVIVAVVSSRVCVLRGWRVRRSGRARWPRRGPTALRSLEFWTVFFLIVSDWNFMCYCSALFNNCRSRRSYAQFFMLYYTSKTLICKMFSSFLGYD